MNGRQISIALFSIGALAAAGVLGYGQWRKLHDLREAPMQPPPEVIAAREARRSPFVPGLSKEERRRRWREQGDKLWTQTTLEQKLEIADGYFPEITKRLNLTPEQVGPVHRVYVQAIRELIPIWDGWTRPGFDGKGPLVQSWMVAARAQAAVNPILNDTQRALLNAWSTEAKAEGEKRERARFGTPTATANATTTSAAPAR